MNDEQSPVDRLSVAKGPVGPFFRKQCQRIASGCVIGVLASGLFHLSQRDVHFRAFLNDEALRVGRYFDGFSTYKPELIVLCFALAALVISFAPSWIWKVVRSWRAGIVSMTLPAVACATLVALNFQGLKSVAITLVTSLAIIIADISYQRSIPPVLAGSFHLNLPVRKRSIYVPQPWSVLNTDDPITSWREDILGRTTIVEILADHALRLRTSIVALNGDFGDGKSSVLNLLKSSVEGHAIVVSFNAWLPGSEATLATDLFADIAARCNDYAYVPQLRKRALAYARTLSRSVSFLSGLRELLPSHSQQYEVEELRVSFSRLPHPIIVLLDEIDRMQKDELQVLLKILRGASSIPNVTFICAFNEKQIRNTLAEHEPVMTADYLEKFFPVSVNLPAPEPEMMGVRLSEELKAGLSKQGWLGNLTEKKAFDKLMERAWDDGLYRVCTNLRKVGLLVNDVLTVAQTLAGEVDAFDLVAVGALRRFFPDVYRLVRTNPSYLTFDPSSWSKSRFVIEERQKKESSQFFELLEKQVGSESEPKAARALLGLLFPAYGKAISDAGVYRFIRKTDEDTASNERRICDGDYFSIYFRAEVPEAMASNAEVAALITELNDAKSESEVVEIFGEVLSDIPANHPKRQDLLWKLGRDSGRLTEIAAERLAYAASLKAESYAYDMMNVGEAARALNLVFHAAERVSTTATVQRVLEGALTRASDDTFARRIIEFTAAKDRNKVLTNFSNVNVDALKSCFIDRMRSRYAPARADVVNISQGDWRAFGFWVDFSNRDRELEREFWRRFIGKSRKRLAQAINFVYPFMAWSSDPTETVDKMLPMSEILTLISELPEDEELAEHEKKGIGRLEALAKGDYPNPGNI